jgi:hypothetical protein
MKMRNYPGKLILSLALLGLMLPSAGCPKGRGYGSGCNSGCDDGSYSFTSVSLDAFSWLGSAGYSLMGGGDDYYYDDATYVDDGYYDSYGYDEYYDEYSYSEDWGGKTKKAGRRK